MPSNWLIFDRIRALTKQHNIFPSERPYQDQSRLDKIGLDSFSNQQTGSLLDQTTLQISRADRYRDYDQMDMMGEISLALDLYADEGSLSDPEKKHTLIIRAKNKRLKNELERLFYHTLRWDSYCRSCIRYLCKYGDMPYEVVLDQNRSSVIAIKHLSIYNFSRIETRNGDLVGFYHMDQVALKPNFFHPWQIAHMRLTNYEPGYYPYGKSLLDGGRRAYRQLRLMEDAALVYRITRAPERRKFTIPVGSIPPKEVPEYIQNIARGFKRQRFFNPTTNTFDERYSPLIQEDDFFLPRRPDGTGPDIDVLPGAENLDQIADIEYFKKKMIAPLKIPFARVGIGDGAGEANDKSLSQSSSEFAKSVQWVQREVANGLTKIAIIHLALRGFCVDDLRGFEIALTATSAMEELYRIETWQTRVNVMTDLQNLGWFPKEWIVTRFTDLSPDEIEEMKEYADTQGPDMGADTPGGGGGGSLPNMDDELEMPGDDESDAANDEEGGDLDIELPEVNQPVAESIPDNDKSLLLEIAKTKRIKQSLNYLERLSETEIDSNYDAIVESNELCGLDCGSYVVESIELSDSDTEEACRGALSDLYELQNTETTDEPLATEITEDDIPV